MTDNALRIAVFVMAIMWILYEAYILDRLLMIKERLKRLEE